MNTILMETLATLPESLGANAWIDPNGLPCAVEFLHQVAEKNGACTCTGANFKVCITCVATACGVTWNQIHLLIEMNDSTAENLRVHEVRRRISYWLSLQRRKDRKVKIPLLLAA